MDPFNDEYFMKQALVEARSAAEEGEVPVGAVIVCNNQIIARAHNQNVKRMLQVTLTSFDGRSGRILCGFSISYFWKNTN